MPTLQTQASSPQVTVNSVIFGDMRRYLIRRVKEMSVMVLRERFADFGLVAYICFARYDSTPLYAGSDAFPFGLLQNNY
jgi:HK97 family phage major capsid protein